MVISLSFPWFQWSSASSVYHTAMHLWICHPHDQNRPTNSPSSTLMDDGSHFWSLPEHPSSRHLQTVLPTWIPYACPLICILVQLILNLSYLKPYQAMVCKRSPWTLESPWGESPCPYSNFEILHHQSMQPNPQIAPEHLHFPSPVKQYQTIIIKLPTKSDFVHLVNICINLSIKIALERYSYPKGPSCTREGNIHSPYICNKANPMTGCTYTRHYNHITFLTLESIYCIDI